MHLDYAVQFLSSFCTVVLPYVELPRDRGGGSRSSRRSGRAMCLG